MEDLCKKTHAGILAGQCPWCDRPIINGLAIEDLSTWPIPQLPIEPQPFYPEKNDYSLWEAYQRCRIHKQPGILRSSLLDYLEKVAGKLDRLRTKHRLQHLDINPRNIFLSGQEVRIADCHLARDGEGEWSLSGGVTPRYAAPEIFDGMLSDHCDQFSLATVYQEMLTGKAPFNGNVDQLILAKLTGLPDVSPLPPNDRPIILRALSKKPEDRFSSCMELMEALRRAT